MSYNDLNVSVDSNNPKVSVIIPVYKTREYLDKCLLSVEAQTYKNIEIVLVDDGSPDDSGTLCDEFKEKSQRDVVVIHQKNQGLSAARNNGVQQSTGGLIFFVDSDDYISNDCIEYLVYLMQKHKSDISIGSYLPVYNDYKHENKTGLEKEEIFNAQDALIEAYYSVKFGMAAWAKLYKRDLIVRYPYPIGVLYEELATTYKILGDAELVAYGNRVVYYYVQRSGSIMSNIGERELYGLTAAKQLLDYTYKRYPGAIHAAKVRYEIKVFQYMPAVFLNRNNEKYFSLLRCEALKYFRETVFDRKAGLNYSIKLCAIVAGKLPSRILFRTIAKKKYG